MTAKKTARRDRDHQGCWHYSYRGFCVTCDPASYGPCESDCSYAHEHCTCDGTAEGHASCAVHEDEDPACVEGNEEDES